MTVRRIVANIATDDVTAVRDFYGRLFDLDVAMDLGWIVTLASDQSARTQVSIMSEGGAGTPAPALSIEVDDVDAAHARALAMRATIAYPLTDEPWGVRRFYLRDPVGTLVNVLSHRP
jgi:predicted enzyme related to lactoylglutathione lyase